MNKTFEITVGSAILSSLFTWLVAVVMGGTLINSGIFLNPTMAAFYSYTVFGSLLILVSGILLVRNKVSVKVFLFPTTSIFLIWALYAWIHGILSEVVQAAHIYILVCNFLFLSLFFLLVNKRIDFRKLCWVISMLGLLEALTCIMQILKLVPSQNASFTVTGTWVNPNVTAMFLAMSIPAYLLLLFSQSGWKRYILVGSICLLAVSLLLLKCRTAFVGASVIVVVFFSLRFQLFQLIAVRSKAIKIILFVTCISILSVCSWFVYKSKQASADGRLFVWNMVSGHGTPSAWITQYPGGFKDGAAHEIGHSLNLAHTFQETPSGGNVFDASIPQSKTNNFMDYFNLRYLFYYYQWKFSY